ncbi:hypothetical protein FZEAL_5373 [Fusarium zealandicum]|uniref:Vacuolar protein sorting-associated protein 62 n=1 Tax=Fusarium zealandicum TaxID=1053134 RepID=A0A8H4UKQ9_9HYPO|nr:hypothetical protein FZEAL_5373 [Fusarium zealandicum]
MPSDILSHIRHTTPKVNGTPVSGLPSLDLDNLEVLNDFGAEKVDLTSQDDPLAPPKWILGEAPDASGKIHNSTPCAVILVEKTKVDVDAFYFYFYSYNEGPNITQVMEPLNRLITGDAAASGMHFGNHVGDWEHNMIRFRKGKPVGIYYSQHVDGQAYNWDDSRVSMTDGRPTVYSGRGSHANYAEPGLQVHNAGLLDYCEAGQKWDPVLSAYYYRFDAATFTITPLIPPKQPSTSSPSSNLTSWFYFKGQWGDRTYPDSDPRQETLPRFKLKRFETGPNGPRFKHLVRKGLVRDEQRKKSWQERFVTIYMYLYPCCIRGWRIWMSLGALAVLLAGAVIGIIMGIRRFKTRGAAYTKIHDEDIALEDWRREEEALFSSDDEEVERRNH